jgi:hypothetical protein
MDAANFVGLMQIRTQVSEYSLIGQTREDTALVIDKDSLDSIQDTIFRMLSWGLKP